MFAMNPNRSAVTLDVQVVCGSIDMEQTWRAQKVNYSRNDMRQSVSRHKGEAARSSRALAMTSCWKSATVLRELGISAGVLRGVTIRILRESYVNW